MWRWWQTASQEQGTGDQAAIEKEIVAKVQVLAREEPKRTGRRDDPKRDVDEARSWLRERGIEPKQRPTSGGDSRGQI